MLTKTIVFFFFLKMSDVLPPKYNTYKTEMLLPDLQTIKKRAVDALGPTRGQLSHWSNFLS